MLYVDFSPCAGSLFAIGWPIDKLAQRSLSFRDLQGSCVINNVDILTLYRFKLSLDTVLIK